MADVVSNKVKSNEILRKINDVDVILFLIKAHRVLNHERSAPAIERSSMTATATSESVRQI